MQRSAFLVKRGNIQEHRIVESDVPEIKAGQILVDVEQFGLTAGNVSYAHSGETLKYWQFFPVSENAWGQLPVWGFANVTESQHSDIAVGTRIFGFLPLATHLVLEPAQVSIYGFVDGAQHRQELNPIYNRYTFTETAPGFKPEYDYLNTLRPQFVTSFLIDDFLRDNAFFGADQIILSSASSKTAYGTALCLQENRDDERTIIGLTSTKNVEFVQSLGCYDVLLAYDAMATLPADKLTVYVDFAGDQSLRQQIHHHWGNALTYSAVVSGVLWDAEGIREGVTGVTPELFFAPSQIQKRMQEWGLDVYAQKQTMVCLSLIKEAHKWIDVSRLQGKSKIVAAYEALVAGTFAPDQGFLLSF